VHNGGILGTQPQTGVDVEELTVIEVSPTAIIAVSRDGQRYTIPVDGELRTGITQRSAGAKSGATSPREIQSLLRSGLSIAEVAERTGEEVDHIARFEAPITAELAFVLERALAVPVTARNDDDATNFGVAIEARLREQGGTVTRWQAYRLNDEWVVGAEFTVGTVTEDATWAFDPRKLTLAPTNPVAVRVSKADAVDAALFPPLRVVAPQTAQRFDSGEFEPVVEKSKPQPVIQIPIDIHEIVGDSVTEPAGAAPTDLLDELHKRRGQRSEAMSSHPSTGSIPVITPEMLEIPDDSPEAPEEPATPVEPAAPEVFIDETPSQRQRRQRAPMPTWDEIVFGTRPIED
jgi:hypothetical protein